MPGLAHRLLVEVDGTALAEHFVSLVVEAYVDDHLVLPDTFMLRFADPFHDLAAQLPMTIGSTVQIATGGLGEDPQATLIHGEVTALEGRLDLDGNHFVVRGYDASHRLHRARRTRSWRDVSDGDVVQRIAQAAGVKVGTIDAPSRVHDQISQVNLTDWEFLRARMREIGHEVVLVDGALAVRPAGPVASGPALEYTMNLIEFRPRITAAQQVEEIEVRGWDYVAKREISATAPATTTSVRLDDSALAPAELARTFEGGTYTSCDRAIGSVPEAQAAARAMAEEIASASAEADGVVVGDPRVKAGVEVEVKGVPPTFAGTWVVSRSRHRFGSLGYHTVFEVAGRQERSLVGLASLGATAGASSAGGPPLYGVVIGIVTDVADPDEMSRVKVTFPWLSADYVTDWARVCGLGAGPGYGASFLPEINDEVLVAFEHGDVRRPYVIGGLWGGQAKMPASYYDSSDGHVNLRFLRSKGGHSITISDTRGDEHITLDVGDAYGIALEKDGQRILIRSDGEIVVEARKTITMTSQADIKLSGMNVTIEASGNLNLKGSGGATLESSGSTTVKGSIVRIN